MKNKIKLAFALLTVLSVFYSCKKKEEEPAPLASANFSFDGTSKPAPVFVQFNDMSTNAVSYLWDFGDGFTSTEKNPKHQFKNSSAYIITLTVKNIDGASNILSKPYSVLPAPSTFTVNKIIVTSCPIPFPITVQSPAGVSPLLNSLPYTINNLSSVLTVTNSTIIFGIGSAGGTQYVYFKPADYILPDAEVPYRSTISVNVDGFVYSIEGIWQ